MHLIVPCWSELSWASLYWSTGRGTCSSWKRPACLVSPDPALRTPVWTPAAPSKRLPLEPSADTPHAGTAPNIRHEES